MNWLGHNNCLPIFLFTVTVQISLVAGFGLFGSMFFTNNAARRHNVLQAAMLCILASPLLVTVAIASGFSISWLSGSIEPLRAFEQITGARHVVPPSAVADRTRHPDPSSKTDFRFAGPVTGSWYTEQFPESGPSPEPREKVLSSASSEATRGFWLAEIAAGLWLIGAAICGTGVVRAAWKTRAVLHQARPLKLPEQTCRLAAQWLGTDVLPPVFTTGRVPWPAVAGLVKPCILIPARYLEEASEDELAQVLVHEAAHAKRRDPLSLLLQELTGAVVWWHPLVHLVNRRLSTAREDLCDNFVLNRVAPEIYGETLLRLATLLPAPTRTGPITVSLLGSEGQLEGRVQAILDQRREIMTKDRVTIALSVFATFLLMSTAIVGTAVSAQTTAPQPPDQAVQPGTTPPGPSGPKELPLATEPTQPNPGQPGIAAGPPAPSLESRVARIEKLLEQLLERRSSPVGGPGVSPGPARQDPTQPPGFAPAAAPAPAVPPEAARAVQYPKLPRPAAPRFPTNPGSNQSVRDARLARSLRTLEKKKAELARLQAEILELEADLNARAQQYQHLEGRLDESAPPSSRRAR